MKEEKVNQKKKKRIVFYNLAVVDKMDVASKACSLKLAITAKCCMLDLTVFKITFQLNLILLLNY